MLDSAWTAAQHSGVVDYMPQSEARKDTSLYGNLDGLTQELRVAVEAKLECQRNEVTKVSLDLGPKQVTIDP
jgi:hypothetical protein